MDLSIFIAFPKEELDEFLNFIKLSHPDDTVSIDSIVILISSMQHDFRFELYNSEECYVLALMDIEADIVCKMDIHKKLGLGGLMGAYDMMRSRVGRVLMLR